MVAGNKVSWEQDGKRQIGYWISRNSRGKGIASQALAQFLTVVKALPLYAYVANPNSASIRILDKKGSKRIGEETDHPPEAGQEPVELLFKLS